MRISDWSSDVCSSDLLTVRKAADHTLRRSPSHRETVMPIEKRVSSAAAALEGIEDGATVLVSGDRKSVVSGKSVSVRVDLGGRRILTKKNKSNVENNRIIYYLVNIDMNDSANG